MHQVPALGLDDTRQSAVNGLHECVVVERLLQEVHRTRLERLARRSHVAMPGDDDDGQPGRMVCQSQLQLQPRHARHADVGQHAALPVRLQRLKKRLCAGEHRRGMAMQTKQQRECVANGCFLTAPRSRASWRIRWPAALQQPQPRSKGPLASWTAWVAPRNISAPQAARQLGISEDELRELNHVPPRMLIKGGSTLLVPRDAQASDVAEYIADHGTLTLASAMHPLRRVYFNAGRRGDRVAAVARRYRVNAGQLAQWNGIGIGARFKAGQRIVVMLPATMARPARASANATAARVAGKKAAPRATKAALSTKRHAEQRVRR